MAYGRRVDETAPETNSQRNAKRLGACDALVCSFGCDGYAFARHADGFDICVCTHTQNSHRQGAPA